MIKIKCRTAVIGLLLFVFLLSCGDQSGKAKDDEGLYQLQEILQTINLS